MSAAAAEVDQALLAAARAGFGRRLVAAFVDGLVVGVVNAVVSVLLGASPGLRAALSLVLSAAYFTFFHGRTGQTPGDAALAIRVVDLRDGTGRPLGYARALTRWAGSILSAIPIFVGYLWMLWDGERQTWHDKLAGSAVVDLNPR
jgi:uncharacterized RDD family membrane protein YckC